MYKGKTRFNEKWRDIFLHKLREIVEDRGAWQAIQSRGSQRVEHKLGTE